MSRVLNVDVISGDLLTLIAHELDLEGPVESKNGFALRVFFMER